MYGVLDMGTGDLHCYKGDDIRREVGFLNVHSEDPDVQKYIQRLVRKDSIQERN